MEDATNTYGMDIKSEIKENYEQFLESHKQPKTIQVEKLIWIGLYLKNESIHNILHIIKGDIWTCTYLKKVKNRKHKKPIFWYTNVHVIIFVIVKNEITQNVHE